MTMEVAGKDSGLISVVIPTYNRAEFLRAAIESVLAQTYPNFELLILDNCSPDHTPQVVASFKDPRIRYVRHLCNIGPPANWVYGISLAKGRYLSILGDDDRYRPDFLLHRVYPMAADPQIVIAFGSFEYWDGNSVIASHDASNYSASHALEGMNAIEAVIGAYFFGASLFRTSVIRAFWNRFCPFTKCDDEMIGILLARQPGNRVVCLTESDLLYRRHTAQDSTACMRAVAEAGGRMYRMLLEKETDRKVRWLLRRQLVRHWNRNGRQFWDLGDTDLSGRCFVEELKIDPFRPVTWLRLLRTFIVRPKPIQTQKYSNI